MFELLENNFLKKDDFTQNFEQVFNNKRKTISSPIDSSRIESESEDSEPMSAGFYSNFITATSQVTGLAAVKNDNRKSIALLFHFYCLSIELRDDDGNLVSEFCLLNTDLGYEAFDSGRGTAFLRAHSFFILHDEDARA